MPYSNPFQHFSPETLKLIEIARTEAVNFRHSWVTTEHLVLAFARDEHSKLRAAMERSGVDVTAVERLCLQRFPSNERIVDALPFAPDLAAVFKQASLAAHNASSSVVHAEHLFTALMAKDCGGTRLLRHLKVDSDTP